LKDAQKHIVWKKKRIWELKRRKEKSPEEKLRVRRCSRLYILSPILDRVKVQDSDYSCKAATICSY